MTRRVLIHYHIYKNAGSSIERMLWESFGSAFAQVEATAETQNIDAAALRRTLNANPQIRAVSSHKARPPLPWPGALPILMLRHPADRALSAWRYARTDAATPEHELACASSFAEYVRWSLATRGPGAVLRDHQVLHLSNGAFRAGDDHAWPATGADLAQAQATIAAWPAFGLVRRFAESCRLFNTLYRPAFPALHLFDMAENTTGRPGLTDEAALAEARAELGATLYGALLDANRLDLELYAFAERGFQHRLDSLDRPAARIGWRLALEAGRIRQRLLHPQLYRPHDPALPEALEPTRL